MSFYYAFEVAGTKHSVAVAVSEDQENSDVVRWIENDLIPMRLERLGVDRADRVWLEDTAGNFVREVEL